MSSIKDDFPFRLEEGCIGPFSFQQIHETLGLKAIVVNQLLSPLECQELVSFMDLKDRTDRDIDVRESPCPFNDSDSCKSDNNPLLDRSGFMTPASTKKEYRNNQRMMIFGDQAARVLFARLAPVLTSLQEATVECHTGNANQFIGNGIGMTGTWQLSSLNSCFRLCKYYPGGHFGPHYDSDFVVDPITHRSLKTFMIYLNDDYEAGETNFSLDHDMHFDEERKIYCSPSNKVFARFKARKGDCLIFDHKLLHEGEQVKQGNGNGRSGSSGCKYIMRTDVMYKKQSRSEDAGEHSDAQGEGQGQLLSSVEETKEEEAVRVYYAGMELEGRGLVDKAIVLYKRAYKIFPNIEQYL